MRTLLLSVLVFAGFGTNRLVAESPTWSPRVSELLRTIRPQPQEDVFATIPWETDLWEARIKAAAAGKPILLWAMDGHPLGCG